MRREKSSSNHQFGQRAEARAARALVRAGYDIVQQNYRCTCGELDIIAYEGDCLVFVEVRSRRGDRYGSGAAQVGIKKQRQVAKVAAVYLAQRRLVPRRCRFDVVSVTGEELEIIRDAFRLF